MILSYHPIFGGDKNLLCAGRDPTPEDLDAIRQAKAVILSQGCPQALYTMARSNCRHVFPNLDAKFEYPGKTGQIRLFRDNGLPHPRTAAFASVKDLPEEEGALLKTLPFKTISGFRKASMWGSPGPLLKLVLRFDF